MVVAGHPEAARIGLHILERGGNAMDAAVATSFALGVAEPYGSGMGGKCVILYFEASTAKAWHVSGMDAAGAELDVGALSEATLLERAEGCLGVGIPGQVAAMDLAHRMWGQLSWEEILEPAADLAEGGFLVVPGMPVFFERRLERIRSHPETRRLYLEKDAVPVVGTRLANPDLARTIRTVAEAGRKGFYEGPVAAAIVEAVQAGGGSLTLEDFRTYQARLSEPLAIDWQDFRILSSPPPVKGGATAFMVMKLLEGHAWPEPEAFLTAGNIDDWCHAFRLTYPLMEKVIGDQPDSMRRFRELLGERQLQEMRQKMLEESPPALAFAGEALLADECTTHFVVADRRGNVASVTQSLSHHFGSGVIAPGTGVILNNTLKNFNFWEADSANAPAPGKRPTSTIAPVIVLRDGHPVLAAGLPGGQRIPTTLTQILLDQLIFGRTTGEAIAAPRVHLRRSFSAAPDSNLIQLEELLPEPQAARLLQLGWKLEVPGDSEFFGGVNAIEIDADGTFTGWADYRRTNLAAGF